MNDNTVKNVYLLDEYLELGFYGQYSQSIVEKVMNEIVEKSYRKTAETIMNNTNVSISYNAARNIVLKVAEKKIKPYEEEKLKLYEQGIIEGRLEKEVENEVKSRFPQPEKIKKIKKVGKIKYCGKNTILESLTGIRKQYVNEMLRLRSFDEIRLIGD
jgi:hypothetical protein